ncbi:MAG: hypothetical protein F4010_00410 [Cenarchaeum sp. SB0669_bin_11]|nr:hypothetical protein [Cenarchaeum sp. SB0669_bin_11]
MSELERTWCEGLRCHRDHGDRDRILAQAGARLGVFDEEASEPLRRSWLRQVAEEVRLRNDQPLSAPLATLATAELREAFALAADDLAGLRAATEDGQDLLAYVERSPASAMRIRDLGRVTERLRGSGALTLVASDDVELSTEFAQSLVPRQPLVALVPEPMRVSRDALLSWPAADRELPRLVRSLIAETEPSAEWIDMPAGTGIRRPGVDGVLKCGLGNRYVPAGLSVWEYSAQKKDCGTKARSDYKKRVKQLPSAERSDMTYVAVMCAQWTNKRAFVRERSQGPGFRSVETLDVDDLEAWLECAPLTTVWLREHWGEPVTGIGLLSGWWAKWLDATTTPLNASVVLAGRDQQASALRDRCRQDRGGAITVGGKVHLNEILAFIAATLTTPENSDSRLADALYVDGLDQAQRLLAAEALTTSGRPSQHALAMTVVVPSTDFAEHLPAGSQHRMIVPVPGSSQADIVLEAVDSEVVASQLQEAGLDLHAAQRLGGLARISLLALWRHLAVDPSLHRPAWATGAIDASLRRSLLLGGWNESREGDREIVEQFVGQTYEAVTEALSKLDAGDAPMVPTGDLWHGVSPEDTWMLVGDQLSPSDIKTFGDIAHEILTEPSPLWGRTGEDLLRAQVEGVRSEYSPQLKQGVATTLALLGTHPPVLRGDASAASDMAPGIVAQVLRSASNDATPETWAAVSEVLPLLAEAAPDTVLESLRTCLSEPHSFARAMFTDGGSDEFDFWPNSPHFRILEALQILAWSPDHLLGVVDVLAGLAEIDPGGRYSNRPSESLASIMCPWMPYTSADADDRLTAIRMLRRSHGSVAWPLMLSMLPRVRSMQMPASRPRYRDWRNAENAVTQREYAQVVTSITDMLLEDVGEDASRWADLVERAADLSEEARDRAIAALGRVADTEPDETFKSTMWPKLQAFVTRHRQYSDAKWALPESELVLFDHVLERLRPPEPAISYGNLFAPGLRYIDGVSASDGWETFQAAVSARQTEAVAAILRDGGAAEVLNFSESVEWPRAVGSALARCDSTLDIEVLLAMEAASDAVTQAALGYLAGRFEEFGWDGINQLIADHDLSPKVLADLHRTPPPIELPWTRVDAHGTEVAAEYWARATYYDLGIPEELSQLLEVTRRLRDAGRFDLARTLLASRADHHAAQPAFADEAAALLEQWIQHPPVHPDRSGMTGYELTELLKALDVQREHLGTARVAAIEWQYYTVLPYDPEFSAPNLYGELARDPDLFTWLVEHAFKPATAAPGDQPPATASQRLIAQNAFQVLHAWPASTFAPGLDAEGGVEAESLNEWVDRARKRFDEIDRVGVGDTLIGTALAASPPDPDGEWPGIAVRGLLERLQNDEIDNGLSIAVHNQRGVTSRSPTAGGDQERELAESYRAQSRHFREWPRTAAIFTSLARSYDHEAGIYDREAEAHRRGLQR